MTFITLLGVLDLTDYADIFINDSKYIGGRIGDLAIKDVSNIANLKVKMISYLEDPVMLLIDLEEDI